MTDSAYPLVVKPLGGARTHRAIKQHSGTIRTRCGLIMDDQGGEPEGTPVSCKRCR